MGNRVFPDEYTEKPEDVCMGETQRYRNPLIVRYSSEEMARIFSEDKKFTTWRKLWIALASGQKRLGLNITEEMLEEMRAHVDDINYSDAVERERHVRHDVMSHVYAYGIQCPKAKGIIHLGATSAFVGDNTDLIVYKEALELVGKKLLSLMCNLKDFAIRYKDMPTLGFTHFQPAQLTTVGKRASMWLQDFYLDYQDVERLIETLPFLSAKGTTGTQASFLELFNGDGEKVKALDEYVANAMGFSRVLPISGQTYTRKLDYSILSILSGIAQSAHKMTNDIRLLQHLKEIEEPFEKNQIGSSAMAYKRNPMRSERIASLARYVISQSENAANTAATQWFERTLDDSANKRMSLPESFLGVDAILDIAANVTSGLVVYEKVIEKHIMEELPFMTTENIMMEAVKKGGDRQVLHEKIREHSMEAAVCVKEHGKANDLMYRIAEDESFGLSSDDIEKLLDPRRYIGRAAEQTEEFINEYIEPMLREHGVKGGYEPALNV